MNPKPDRQLQKAELVYTRELLKILRPIFLIRPTGPNQKIDPAAQFKRTLIKDKLYAITAQLYSLGLTHATDQIQLSAAVTESVELAFAPYDKYAVNELTDHTVNSMTYIADEVKPDLINTLEEGYKNGESIPKLSQRVSQVWSVHKVQAVRFSRTATNEIYNQAHMNRYKDSGIVDGVRFSAHLDNRTSPQCRMLNGTIWALNDPDILRPPLHFFCRSRIAPYFGKVPGARDFSKSIDGTEFTPDQIAKIQANITTFRGKYWSLSLKEVPKPYPGKMAVVKPSIEDVEKANLQASTIPKNTVSFESNKTLTLDEHYAVDSYVGEDFTAINGFLRNPPKGTNIGKLTNVEENIAKIDSAIAKNVLSEDTALYRAISPDAADELVEAGFRISPGYSSTTLDPAYLDYFTEQYNEINILVMERKAGNLGLYINDAEYEVLLPKGINYKLTGIKNVEELVIGGVRKSDARLLFVELS